MGPEGLIGPIGTRWKGKVGMTSLPKELARDLELRLSTRIKTIEQQDTRWHLQAESGETFQFEKLLITSPVPQSLALIENLPTITPKIKERLQAIDYDPCLALLVSPTAPSTLPAPGGLSLQDHPILLWIADNQQKGISSLPSITIHAQGEWSKTHFEADEADIVKDLITAAQPYLGQIDIQDSQLMRWRYSQPIQETVSQDSNMLYCQVSEQPLLLLAGDAFGGSWVEGAMRSGLAAAQRLLGA
jgi:renalase